MVSSLNVLIHEKVVKWYICTFEPPIYFPNRLQPSHISTSQYLHI